MGTPQITAPQCALSPAPGDATPSSGVIHINFRHAAGFTVIGNHLAQHRGLSLTAIGLAAHIQSLPAGARIGIKHLAERFPESETRIAAALRELEAHGYLHRSAAAILADLRRHTPQLTISENDIHTLTPGVATWLERDAHPDTIRHALTTNLPVPPKPRPPQTR